MRLAVGIMSVALGLGSLSYACAQTYEGADTGSSWNWLSKKASAPTKPSANPQSSNSQSANSQSANSQSANSQSANSQSANPQSPKSQLPKSQLPKSPSKDAAPSHVLRQTTCNIPFTVDLSKNAPLELQLYVSQDRATTWKFYAKAAPTEGHFTFRAIADGEYWFALRSVEKNMAPIDVKKLVPGLKVIFDTREPEFRFDATLSDSGEVLAIWKVNDPTLVVDSLKVEYQTDPNTPWRLVAVPNGSATRDGSLSGNHKWTPDGVSDSVHVRAEVSDRAGNKSVISRKLVLREGGGSQTADNFRSRARPDGTYPVAQEGQSWPADNKLPTKATSPPKIANSDLPPPKPTAAAAPPAGQPVRNPFISARQPSVNGEGIAPSGDNSVPSQFPQFNAADNSASNAEEIAPVTDPTPVVPAAPRQESATIPSQPYPSTSNNDPQRTDPSSTLPNGERPRMTKARQFSLDYEVDAIGSAGVARVELWGTNDGGRNWKHWQDDQDRQSPLDVTVDQDGIFGFRIVISSSNQLVGAPPQPGDPADLWVGVDTSVPTVRLTSALYGDAEHAGQLDIRWQAFDVWFRDRPITLLFSEHAQGPWMTIASGLPNSGQYYWVVEPRIPRRIYLRIEARDEAGNFAEHQIAEAISTAGLVPQGRIRGLRTPAPTPAPTEDRSARRPW